MVPDSGKTLRAGAYKPVNLPEPIGVDESADGEPLAVRIPPLTQISVGQASPHIPVARASSPVPASPPVPKTALRQTVNTIDDRWRIDDEWWRSEPVSRLYYTVLLTSGQRLVIYRDLITGQWYRQVY